MMFYPLHKDHELVADGDTIGLMRGEEYKPQTNFDFKFVAKVLPPSQLSDYSGFIVEVTHSAGPTPAPITG